MSRTLTKQEAFNLAYRGLKSQGFKSSTILGTISCVYRHPDGLKCAVGHIMTDEEYRPNFDEHSGVTAATVARLLNWQIVDEPFQVDFLTRLQEVHDEAANPSDMVLRLEDFADSYNLEIPND